MTQAELLQKIEALFDEYEVENQTIIHCMIVDGDMLFIFNGDNIEPDEKVLWDGQCPWCETER